MLSVPLVRHDVPGVCPSLEQPGGPGISGTLLSSSFVSVLPSSSTLGVCSDGAVTFFSHPSLDVSDVSVYMCNMDQIHRGRLNN